MVQQVGYTLLMCTTGFRWMPPLIGIILTKCLMNINESDFEPSRQPRKAHHELNKPDRRTDVITRGQASIPRFQDPL